MLRKINLLLIFDIKNKSKKGQLFLFCIPKHHLMHPFFWICSPPSQGSYDSVQTHSRNRVCGPDVLDSGSSLCYGRSWPAHITLLGLYRGQPCHFWVTESPFFLVAWSKTFAPDLQASVTGVRDLSVFFGGLWHGDFLMSWLHWTVLYEANRKQIR